MKKYLMKQNVIHDNKKYPAGTEIKEQDEAFKTLFEAGYVEVLEFESDEKPSEQEKPAAKSKK